MSLRSLLSFCGEYVVQEEQLLSSQILLPNDFVSHWFRSFLDDFHAARDHLPLPSASRVMLSSSCLVEGGFDLLKLLCFVMVYCHSKLNQIL
ncbi:hypothetical protein JRO89_XS05G0122900 [Xanthoceras sorbifolium]|uniref:Uncharacterized protein n=1 Tax=Xanthoceras sorbifolium TaxID=99658 RepID=A0ABQ8I1M0_9ROSI|nr:hypothetical protein JRO89_XS05G0122900 [Xanthoceras sorbifolium]